MRDRRRHWQSNGPLVNTALLRSYRAEGPEVSGPDGSKSISGLGCGHKKERPRETVVCA
jgi:hypothetical protein